MKIVDSLALLKIRSNLYGIFDTNRGYYYAVSKEELESVVKNRKLLTKKLDFKKIRTNSLEVWLHITNRCNLRCKYCYIVKSDESSNTEVLRKSIYKSFQIARIKKCNYIKFKLSGGEASCEFKLVKYSVSLIKKLSKSTNITGEIVLLSNGYILSDEIINYVKEEGIRLMISIDGLKKYNDQYRLNVVGKGTFHNIDLTLKKLRKVNITPFISITVTDYSSNGLSDLIEYLYFLELYDISLNFVRWFDGDKVKEKAFVKNIADAYAIIEKNIQKPLNLSGLLDRVNFNAPHLSTCGAGKNYLVFDHNGNLKKCHMLISMKDPVKLKKYNLAIENINKLPFECTNCPWRYWCSGGCPLIRVNNKNPYCSIYKSLIPKWLRLIALKSLADFEVKNK